MGRVNFDKYNVSADTIEKHKEIFKDKGLVGLGFSETGLVKKIAFTVLKIFSLLTIVFAPVTFFLINRNYKAHAIKIIETDNISVLIKDGRLKPVFTKKDVGDFYKNKTLKSGEFVEPLIKDDSDDSDDSETEGVSDDEGSGDEKPRESVKETKEERYSYFKQEKYWKGLSDEQVLAIDFSDEKTGKKTFEVIFTKDGFEVSEKAKKLIPLMKEKVTPLFSYFKYGHWKLLSDEQILAINFSDQAIGQKAFDGIFHKIFTYNGYVAPEKAKEFIPLMKEKVTQLFPYFEDVHWELLSDEQVLAIDFSDQAIGQKAFDVIFNENESEVSEKARQLIPKASAEVISKWKPYMSDQHKNLISSNDEEPREGVNSESETFNADIDHSESEDMNDVEGNAGENKVNEQFVDAGPSTENEVDKAGLKDELVVSEVFVAESLIPLTHFPHILSMKFGAEHDLEKNLIPPEDNDLKLGIINMSISDFSDSLQSFYQNKSCAFIFERLNLLEKQFQIRERSKNNPEASLTFRVKDLLLPWSESLLKYGLIMDDEFQETRFVDVANLPPELILSLFRHRVEKSTASTGVDLDNLLLRDCFRLTAVHVNENHAKFSPGVFCLLSPEVVSEINIKQLSDDQKKALFLVDSLVKEILKNRTSKEIYEIARFLHFNQWSFLSNDQVLGFDFSDKVIGKKAFNGIFTEGGYKVSEKANELIPLMKEKVTPLFPYFENYHWKLLSNEQVLVFDFSDKVIGKKAFDGIFTEGGYKVSERAKELIPLMKEKVTPLFPYFENYHWKLLSNEQVLAVEFRDKVIGQKAFNGIFTKGGYGVSERANKLIPLMKEKVTPLFPYFENDHWNLLSDDQVLALDFSDKVIGKKAFNGIFTKGGYGVSERANKLIPLMKEKVTPLFPYFENDHWNLLSNEQVLAVDFSDKVIGQKAFNGIFTKGGYGVSERAKELIPLMKENVTQLFSYFERDHWKLLSDEQVLAVDFSDKVIGKKAFNGIFTEGGYKVSERAKELIPEVSDEVISKWEPYMDREHKQLIAKK